MKKSTRILCLVLSALMLLLCAACGGNEQGESSGTASTDKTESKTESSNAKPEGTYFATDIWKQVPLVTQEALDMGFVGGEGCQWLTWVAFDRIDGSTAYAGVDVGGMMKSTDGGKSWNQSTVGFDSEGATGITVDPKNKARVIAIGCGGGASGKHGLYLSTDEGFSWSGKRLLAVKSNRDYRRQVAFDESSYDESIKGCKIIYWSTENLAGLDGKGVYKSTDGGETWSFIDNSADYAGSNLAVDPKTGTLYLSNDSGLYKLTDGTTIVETSFKNKITYLDTSKAEPTKIYMTTDSDIYVYDMSNDTATAVGATDYPGCATYLSVAQSDPKIMVLQSDRLGMTGQYNNANYYSHDGGKTWTKSTNDYSGSFIPYNHRQNPHAIHPTNPNVVLKLGGDFIMRSDDGGKNYKLSNDGNNAMCIGGQWNFNVNNSKLVAVSSQDYNGGFSIDGGKTWKYINWSGQGWGGMTYGAYCINETSVVAGYSSGGWYEGEVEIVTTFDGGVTINHTGIMTKGSNIGCGVIGNDDIVFFADHRSTDGGHTWEKMNGCTGVYTSSADGKKLFGVNGYYIVMSEDNGVTWNQITTLGNATSDIAYNDTTGKLFATAGGLFEIDLTTKKFTQPKVGVSSITSVDIDPTNNNIMYVTSKPAATYAHDSVMRSLDGGKTWTCLNRAVNDGREGPDGGRAASWVRIDGEGSAWVVCHCRGIWKIARPEI